MIKRDYYKLKQAAEILHCSEDDLIHFAANDSLEICVLTAGFDVESQRVDLFEGEPIGAKEYCFDKKPKPLTTLSLSEYEARADRAYAYLKSVTIYQENPGLPIEKIKYDLWPKPTIPKIIYSHKNRAHRPPAFELDRPPLVSDCEMVIMADELERFKSQSQTKKKSVNPNGVMRCLQCSIKHIPNTLKMATSNKKT